MASTSKIANPDFARAVAEAYSNGMPTEEMADLFNVHRDTIRSWIRDPRVQAVAGKMVYERTLRITRKLDSKMEEVIDELVSSDEPDPELILKIRKEYMSRSGATEVSGVTHEQVGDTVKALEENPGLADALKELLGPKKAA